MTTMREAALACALSMIVGCGATTRAAHSCAEPSSCASGETCVRATCTAQSPTPFPRDAARVVLEPDAAVYVTSRDGAKSVRQIPTFSLGSRARVLVSFATPDAPTGPSSASVLVAAFLVFDRAPSASSDLSLVTVRASAIDEPWSPSAPADRGDPRGGAATTWASPPHATEIATATLTTSATGDGSVRLDVTSYARALLDKRGAPVRGLRVEATSAGEGLAIATGSVAGERGPRLELYFTR